MFAIADLEIHNGGIAKLAVAGVSPAREFCQSVLEKCSEEIEFSK